jgi:hypothetical protein
MNFVIHRERGRLKTCRTLSVLFCKLDVIDDPKNSRQIDSIYKLEPNNQSSSRQHVIPAPFRNFSLG